MTCKDLYDQQYYDNMRGNGLQTSPNIYQHFMSHLAEFNLSQLKILDAGCGRGDLLELLFRAGGSSTVGFDFSENAVQIARKKLAKLLGENKVCEHIIQGDIGTPDLFPNESFDLIVTTDLVEHLDPDLLNRGLTNLAAWLKPGGKILVHTFPTLGPHKLFMNLLKLRGNKQKMELIGQIHCNVQTRESISNSISNAGLRIDRIWLQNDLVMTSSEFQSWPEGFFKSCIKFLFQDFLNHKWINTLFGIVGLAEWVSPSIYLFAGRVK